MRPSREGQKVYLSGPMTGLEFFNRIAFDRAAMDLRLRGFEVYVPGEGEHYTNEELAARKLSRAKEQLYLSRDIDVIQEWADLVVVLPGWTQSNGSLLEVAVARALGVPVFDYTTGHGAKNVQLVPEDTMEQPPLSELLAFENSLPNPGA